MDRASGRREDSDKLCVELRFRHINSGHAKLAAAEIGIISNREVEVRGDAGDGRERQGGDGGEGCHNQEDDGDENEGRGRDGREGCCVPEVELPPINSGCKVVDNE